DLGLPKGDIRFGLQKGDGLLEFFLVDALGNQHGHASYPLPVSGSNSVQLSLMVINPENEPHQVSFKSPMLIQGAEMIAFTASRSPSQTTLDKTSVEDLFYRLIDQSLEPGGALPSPNEVDTLRQGLLKLTRVDMESILESLDERMQLQSQNNAGQIPDFEKIAWMNELVLEVMFANTNTEHEALREEMMQAARLSLENQGREPSAEQMASFADELAAMDFDALSSFSMALMIGMEEALGEDAELPWLMELIDAAHEDPDMMAEMERQEAEWEAEQRAEWERILNDPNAGEGQKEMIRELMAMEDAMALEESLRKARSRMDAAILRDDLEAFKSLLSEYGTIEDLMADLLENPIMGDPAMEEDVFMQRGQMDEIYRQSPLNKAILAQKKAFCEASLPLYADINFGQPLLAALRSISSLWEPFDTTDGGDFFDSKDDLFELQDALLETLEKKGPNVEIIQWLLEKGADPDTHGALHMAMQNPSQVSDTVVQALLEKGASPNLLAYQSPEFHFIWGSERHSLSPLDVSLSEDELGGLEPPVAQAYQDAVSALVQAGGKHTNAYQAGVKGKEEVFRTLTENQGGANALYKGRPMLQAAILGRDFSFQKFLIQNGADLQYLDPETGRNYLELKVWVERPRYQSFWREDSPDESPDTEILETLKSAGLRLKDVYCAIAANDPEAFKPFMTDSQALRERAVLSSSRMLSRPGEDHELLLAESNRNDHGDDMGFNAMELALRLGAWQIFDLIKESEPRFEINGHILTMEMSNLCEEDSPTYQKWKEVLDLDLQVSLSSESYIPSSLCDEALGMVEALCGVDLEERDRIREEQASRPRFQENETQEWTKGLTLEQTYLFKGGDTPEEGLVLKVYSNGQASLMGSPPMQATITQGNITLSPPEGAPTGVGTLVLQLDESKGTFKVLVDGKMEDQGTYTTGISEGIMDPAHAAMSSAAVDKANAKALAVRCSNQMKRIGLAFNIKAGDHEGVFPQHTEDYQETRDIDEEGFDTNRIRILSVALKNELLRWDLTCPADEMLGSALDRDSLQDQDISYRLRTGDLVTGDHPDEVLIQCEVHPHVLLADGSVRQMSRSEMQAFETKRTKDSWKWVDAVE
ncbi:MAG: hypothetical protein CMI64_14250, partial [Pedosphaera sp.]|nr:hypothetical protein [Pedosphaera sp.]